jgi:hypothetical protein
VHVIETVCDKVIPEGSLLFLQETAVGLYPEPDEIQSMRAHSI